MADLLVYESGIEGAQNNKSKGEKFVLGTTIDSAQRKKLADISNFLEKAKQTCHGARQQQQPISVYSKEYAEKLEKENMTLMRVLADRNKLIELSGNELQKLRKNLQQVQEQNLKLAQANSQMLAELNTSRNRLRALQHELGCKNGLLRARQMQLEEQANLKLLQTSENKVGTNNHGEAGDSFPHDDVCDQDSKICNTKRSRQSKLKSSGSSNVRSVEANDNVHKKRRVSGRKNAASSEETENTGIFQDANETKEAVDDKRQGVERQSARFKSQEFEPIENLDDVKEMDKNMRPSRRRQSTRFKSNGGETTENVREENDGKGMTKNRRSSVRNQATRCKSQGSASSDETDEPRCQASQSDNIAHKSNPSHSELEKDCEEERKNSFGTDDLSLRRTSVGRPSRRAAEKVQSYKELSRKVKMRRPE